jgi:hypothetical protein
MADNDEISWDSIKVTIIHSLFAIYNAYSLARNDFDVEW